MNEFDKKLEVAFNRNIGNNLSQELANGFFGYIVAAHNDELDTLKAKIAELEQIIKEQSNLPDVEE